MAQRRQPISAEDIDPDGFDYNKEPGFLIRRLQQIATSIFIEKAKEYEVTPIQFAAMNAIELHSDYDQRQIARAIAIDRTTMNSVTKRLEERGWIVRSRRGRRIDLSLTREGARVLHKVERSIADHQNELLAPLSKKDRKTFLTLLQRLVETNNELSRVPVSRPKSKRDGLLK